jgi:hypothetical protein
MTAGSDILTVEFKTSLLAPTVTGTLVALPRRDHVQAQDQVRASA